MPDDEEDPRRALARRLRREGKSRKQIQQAVGGMSNTRLSEWLRDLPVPGWTARPRAKDEVRAEAVRLRLEGLTYDEIEQKLGVSKGSLSLWLRHLPRPARDPEKIRAHVEHMQAVRRGRFEAERERQQEAAAGQLGGLTARELLVVGIALYWAEGTKSKPYARRERVTFINSDPDVIRVFVAWLDLLDVPREDRGYRVAIHETADARQAVEYWARVVGADASQFLPDHHQEAPPGHEASQRGRGLPRLPRHSSAPLARPLPADRRMVGRARQGSVAGGRPGRFGGRSRVALSAGATTL